MTVSDWFSDHSATTQFILRYNLWQHVQHLHRSVLAGILAAVEARAILKHDEVCPALVTRCSTVTMSDVEPSPLKKSRGLYRCAN